MEYKDYYEVLGVPKTATQAEIKKAYRRLARQLHPDRNPTDSGSEQRFKEVNEAHAVLSDPAKRKRYDELGANWQAYQQYGGEGPFAGSGPSPGSAGEWGGAFGAGPGGTRFTYRRVSPEEMGDFSDFFRTFFGDSGFSFETAGGSPFEQAFEFSDAGGARISPGRSARTQTMAARAPDAHAEAQVTLAEVARGTQRTVSIDGRRIQVTIPPGVADGARIKLRGAVRGTDGSNAPAGDLYLTVRVQPDARFERRGADLATEVPITLAEAITGDEVPVPTPTGHVKLRIRPNTQNGQEIHVAGRGLPRTGKGTGASRGDLIVRVRIVLPQLDDESRSEIAAALARHPQPDPRSGASKSAEVH